MKSVKKWILAFALTLGIFGCGERSKLKTDSQIPPEPSTPIEKAKLSWVPPQEGERLFSKPTKLKLNANVVLEMIPSSKENSTPLTVNQMYYQVSRGKRLDLKYTHHLFFSKGTPKSSAKDVFTEKTPFCALGVNATNQNLDDWFEKDLIYVPLAFANKPAKIHLHEDSEFLLETGSETGLIPDWFLKVSMAYEQREITNAGGLLFYCGSYTQKMLSAEEGVLASPRPLTYKDAAEALGNTASLLIRAE